MKMRCGWTGTNPQMTKYHDREWGRPLSDDRKIFEFLLLEMFQAGLSWSTVLNKRENFRRAFDNFDYKIISRYKTRKIKTLMNNAGIIRNKLKINAAVQNARVFIVIQKEFGNFNKYIWRFVGGKPKINKWKTLKQIPARTKESDAMSKDLKKRGMTFVGSTICYAHMQATGMVNDHIVSCFRYKKV